MSASFGSLLWVFILVLHILSMAYWIGGSITTLQTRRMVRLLEPAQASQILLQRYSRFVRGLLHVIPICVLTGIALFIRLSHRMGGNIPWPYHLMALGGLGMLVVFVSIYVGPLRTARRSVRPDSALFTSMHRRTLLMLLLGVITVCAAALGQG